MTKPEPAVPVHSLSPEEERHWEQYTLHLDLYKTHLDIVVKVLGFYYGITGAIISYYLAHKRENPQIKLALFLPLLFSIAFAVIGFRGSRLILYTQRELKETAKRFGLYLYAPLTGLINLLRLAGAGCTLTALGLLYLLLR